MNKKILSIFALIMAISILGVSCAKDNNTTTPPTPPITLNDAKEIVKALGSDFSVKDTGTAVTITFNLTDTTVLDSVKESGANYTTSVTGDGTLSGGAKSIHIDALKKAVEEKINAIETAVNGLTVTSVVPAKTDNKNATVTINYTTEKGKAAIVITFTLPDDSTSNTIAYDDTYEDISLTEVEDALKGVTATISNGSIDFSSITLDPAGTFSVDAVSDNNTALTAATISGTIKTAIEAIDITGAADTANADNLAAASGNASGTITLTLTPEIGYKFSGFNTVDPNGSVAITITVVSKVTNSDQQEAANFK